MELINIAELAQFCSKHPGARKPLSKWKDATQNASWRNFSDLRQTFQTADYVNDLVIFDIGGNNFRLIARVNYFKTRVSIIRILTHAEYDRWKT